MGIDYINTPFHVIILLAMKCAVGAVSARQGLHQVPGAELAMALMPLNSLFQMEYVGTEVRAYFPGGGQIGHDLSPLIETS